MLQRYKTINPFFVIFYVRHGGFADRRRRVRSNIVGGINKTDLRYCFELI